MNTFLYEANIYICYFDTQTEEIELNKKAQKFHGLTSRLISVFKNIISNNLYSTLSILDTEELLFFNMGKNENNVVFAFLNSLDIEKQIYEMEPIKALSNEIDVILNSMHDDILITDGKGIIIRTYPSFENLYNIKKEAAEGRSIYELEKEGVFKPSITAIVLEKKEQVTMMQENVNGRKIIVTAIPIRNQKGEILKVISFSRDLTEYLNLKEQYEMQEERIQKYSAEIEKLRGQQRNIPGLIIGSKTMQSVIEMIDKVATFDANIVLEGESGVGKTMFAKIIHLKSLREQGPFIDINCGAIPENLLESELFGYEKGAFTGANANGKIGLIQLADKGTLFLDEIGELSLNLQTKLLKVIQDKEITRVGGTKPIKVDFRLIVATNKNLKQLVADSQFREDLYYRLNVIYINIPPLRERKEDIFNLGMHYLNNFNKKYNLKKTFSPEVIDVLINYAWPGNIRELENLIERIILTSSDNSISASDLPENLKPKDYSSYQFGSLDKALEQLERRMVIDAYMKHKTTTGVAKELGISQPTAVRKIQKYVSK